MARIIGIDLGTTNSCVATLDGPTPRVLADADGERTVPSVVAFPEQGGQPLVGIPARRQAVTNPARTIFGSKRLIGRKVNAPDVQEYARVAPFRIVAAPSGDAWLRLDDTRDVSPQEVGAWVLEKMRKIAEAALGEPVTQAVITVPAYFNDAQRQATRDAGKLAGLDVRRILNEPTAAALAYGVHRKKGRQRLAVFDLGGGTFDVTVMSVESGVFEVLATAGDMSLGGDDFDRLIVDLVVREARAAHGIELGGDPVALGRVKEEAEKAKKALSSDSSTVLRLPFLALKAGNPLHLERTLSRAELEQLAAPLIDRLTAPSRQALADAGLSVADLDEVLLVGGMSRMPAVQAAVERIFARKPSKGANPDEIVALGAAAEGGILTGDLEGVVLVDVLPQSLGIKVGDGAFSVVMTRNTSVPARARKLFATSRDNQPFVSVEIFQGESQNVKENRHLGRFTLEGLPEGKAGSVRVELNFLVDVDGIVHVSARELSTGKEASLKIAPSGGLDAEEMARLLEARRQPPSH
jgi:molecular chaperone DnaK